MKLFPLLLVSLVALIHSNFSVEAAFVSKAVNGWSVQKKNQFKLHQAKPEIVDVDFEPVKSSNENNDINSMSKNTDSLNIFSSGSLLDMTTSDNNDTFPFVDPKTDNAIFCRLAATANMTDEGGGTYAVGIPEDHGVLMIVESGDGIVHIDPDASESLEILEIMAGALQKHVSPDLNLQRTPKILTIGGDLDVFTNKFNDNLLSDEMTLENLAKDPDADPDEMDAFFKEQFGMETYNKYMEEFEENKFDPDFLEFVEMFEGSEEDDESPTSLKDLEQMVGKMKNNLQDDGAGLKIVGFSVKQKGHPQVAPNVYSLVKPMKPLTVVGRLRRDLDDKSTIFELLTPEEEQIIIPKMEQICEKEMKNLGVDLDSSNSKIKT